MNLIKILIYGNLIFFIIQNQLVIFTTQNIYVPASFLLNIFLLLELSKISKLPKTFSAFFLISSIGLGASYEILIFSDFFTVFIKFLWILTSVFLINHIVRKFSLKSLFDELSKFSILIGYLLVTDLLLTFIFVKDVYVVNEGFKTILMSSGTFKKLALIALPFIFFSSRKNLPLGLIIFIYLLLGTRALILATGFIFLFVAIYYLRKSSKNFFNRIFLTSFFLLIVASSIFLNNNIRTVQFSNIISSIDRVVVWAQYSNVILDYPFGLGPEGAFYLLSKNPSREGIELTNFTNLLIEQEENLNSDLAIDVLVEKRMNINIDVQKRSSESLFLDFISSFGIVGFFLAVHLILILVKDLKKALSFKNLNLTSTYCSLCSTLIYGFFNSYHDAILFVMIFYLIYLFLRKSILEENISHENKYI